MLHGPETNQCTGSSQASFTVDGNCAMVGLLKVILDNCEEVSHDAFRRRRSIYEEQVVVCYSLLVEVLFVVFLFIESDDS